MSKSAKRKKVFSETLAYLPDPKRVLRIAQAKSPCDVIDDLAEEYPSVDKVRITDGEFEEKVRSELEQLNSVSEFLGNDRISNPVVDSAVFATLLPVSLRYRNSEFFRRRVLKQGDRLLADPKIVADAQKRLFRLSLGDNFHRVVAGVKQQSLKPILAERGGRNRPEKRVHFLPDRGDVVPRGAVVINMKECEEAKKSRKKNKERLDVIDFEKAMIEEVRMQYRAYGKGRRDKGRIRHE